MEKHTLPDYQPHQIKGQRVCDRGILQMGRVSGILTLVVVGEMIVEVGGRKIIMMNDVTIVHPFGGHQGPVRGKGVPGAAEGIHDHHWKGGDSGHRKDRRQSSSSIRSASTTDAN